jgi:hypothetical protein
MQPGHQLDRNITGGWAAMGPTLFCRCTYPASRLIVRHGAKKPHDAIAFFQFLAVLCQNADNLVAFTATYTPLLL